MARRCLSWFSKVEYPLISSLVRAGLCSRSSMKTGAKSDHVRGALSVVVLSITIQLWNINLFVTRSIERIEFMTYFLYLSLTYLSHKGVLATKHPWQHGSFEDQHTSASGNLTQHHLQIVTQEPPQWPSQVQSSSAGHESLGP